MCREKHGFKPRTTPSPPYEKANIRKKNVFLARPEPPHIAAAPPTEAFLEPAMGTPFIFSPSETGGGGGKDSEVVVGEEAVLVLRDTDLQVFEM